MDTYKTNTRVNRNHKILVENVPFEDGEEVEIVISKINGNESFENLKKMLKGSVVKYVSPFEAAIDSEDWEILK